MRFQKIGNSPVGINLIFDLRKTVAFVLVDFVFDHAAAFLDRIDYLLRFGLGTARILSLIHIF